MTDILKLNFEPSNQTRPLTGWTGISATGATTATDDNSNSYTVTVASGVSSTDGGSVWATASPDANWPVGALEGAFYSSSTWTVTIARSGGFPSGSNVSVQFMSNSGTANRSTVVSDGTNSATWSQGSTFDAANLPPPVSIPSAQLTSGDLALSVSLGNVLAVLNGLIITVTPPAGPSISDITINADTNTISGNGSFPNTISSIAIAAGGGTDTISSNITSAATSFSAAYAPSHVPFTSSSVDVTLTDSTNATASFTTSIGAPTGYQAVVATAPINTDPSQSVLTTSNVAGDQMETATRDDNNLGAITQNPDGSLKFTWDSGTPPAQTTFKSYLWDSVNAIRGSLRTFTVEKGIITVLDNNNFDYFKSNGSAGRDYNVAALQYYLANGATSKDINVALRQAQKVLRFRGYSPADIRNR